MCRSADRAACPVQTTVWEAMLFSAKLRLPGSVSATVVSEFVEEIMDVVELTPLRNALIGLPGLLQATSLRIYTPCTQRMLSKTGAGGCRGGSDVGTPAPACPPSRPLGT